MARILLIDDTPETSEVLGQLLQAAGHKFYAIDGWADASPVLFNGDFDLVLIDVNMPGLRGDHLADIITRMLSGAGVRPHLVLYSALDESELAALTRESQADAYISKQTPPAQLVGRINRQLQRGRPPL